MEHSRTLRTCYLIPLFMLLDRGISTIQISPFIREDFCRVQDRIVQGCSKEVSPTRGFKECMAICGRAESCVGASEDEASRCFHHHTCPSVTCGQPDAGHRYMARYCQHGSWDASTRTCVCMDEISGSRCDVFQNCRGPISVGHSAGDYYVLVDPLHDGADPVRVLCLIHPPSWFEHVILMNRGRGVMWTNRTWVEYIAGFHEDGSHHWAGLRPWKVLSDVGLTHLVFAVYFTSGSTVYRIYADFQVEENDGAFSFSYSSSEAFTNGDPPDGAYAGECFESIQHTPFSTWDQDRDGSMVENCASQAGSGWWYSDCSNPCNVLGGGLDHVHGTPDRQRLSYDGVDVRRYPSLIDFVKIYVQ